MGKLVFWAVGKVFGYDRTACSFVNIGDNYGPKCSFMLLRLTSSFFGAALIPLIYLIARNFGSSPRGAALAALLVNFDGLNLGESRLILMDAQLMFW